MAIVCDNCSAEVDDQYGASHLNCQECGRVISEGQIVSVAVPRDATQFRGQYHFYPTNRPYYMRGHGVPRIPEGVNRCIAMAENVCFTMGHSALYPEMKGTIKKVFKNEHFVNRHTSAKLTIAACCIYLVLRSRGHPVTFSDLERHCKVVPTNFERWKCRIRDHFPEFAGSLERTPTEEVVGRVGARLGFDRPLVARAERVLGLAQSLWAAEGQKPEPLAMACLYLAWASESPRERAKTKVAQFCRQHKIRKVAAVSRHVTTLLKVMRELAERMPWFVAVDPDPSGSAAMMGVLLHLDDILQFRDLLVSETSGTKRPRSDDDGDEAYAILKRARPDKPKGDGEGEESPIVPILPEGLDLLREELDDFDLDQGELEEYVRTPGEVAAFARVRELIEEAERSDEGEDGKP